MPYIPPPMSKEEINNLVRHHIMSMQLAESRMQLALIMARINGILEFAGRDYRLTMEEVLALGVEAENALNDRTTLLAKELGEGGKAPAGPSWRYLDVVTDTLRNWSNTESQRELRSHYNAGIERLEVLSSQIEQAERGRMLKPIQVGDILLKPSKHLKELAENAQTVFKVDDDGYPEIWLGERLWEISGRGIAPAGSTVDPGAPGPVVRVMALEDQAFIVAWLNKPETPSGH